MKVIYEISKLESPPLYIPLGKEALAGFRSRAEMNAKAADTLSKWSEDLAFD